MAWSSWCGALATGIPSPCPTQGRFTIAAKHHISIAEIYETELVDIEKVRGRGGTNRGGCSQSSGTWTPLSALFPRGVLWCLSTGKGHGHWQNLDEALAVSQELPVMKAAFPPFPSPLPRLPGHRALRAVCRLLQERGVQQVPRDHSTPAAQPLALAASHRQPLSSPPHTAQPTSVC